MDVVKNNEKNYYLYKYIHIYEYDNVWVFLGSMWAQNWQLYEKLIIPFPAVNLAENLKQSNWTTNDIVKRADDFYSSLGLPAMTKQFWKNSYFQKNGNLEKCHGTAANMYFKDDYR